MAVASLAYLLTTVLVGLPALFVLFCTLFVGAVTVVLVVGAGCASRVPMLAGLLGVLERRRLALMLDRPASGTRLRERLRAGAAASGVVARAGLRVPARRRSVARWTRGAPLRHHRPGHAAPGAWLVTVDRMEVLGWDVDPGAEAWLAVLVGLLALVGAAYVVALGCGRPGGSGPDAARPARGGAGGHGRDLRRSRVDLVGAFETERRRIERDLHDGVQQRLVALTMTLGRAELDVPDGPG